MPNIYSCNNEELFELVLADHWYLNVYFSIIINKSFLLCQQSSFLIIGANTIKVVQRYPKQLVTLSLVTLSNVWGLINVSVK